MTQLHNSEQKTRSKPIWVMWPTVVCVTLLLLSGLYLVGLYAAKTARNTLFYLRSLDSDTVILAKAKQYPVRDLTKDTKSMAYLQATPIFISMSTSPARIDKIARVLSTIDLQYVNKVIINIAPIFPRTGESYVIPTTLSKHEKVYINHIKQDYGPATKLLPGIEYAQTIHPNALVITLDDDHAYPQGIVNEHIFAMAHGASVSNVQDDRIGDLGKGYFKLPEKNPNLLSKWPDHHYNLIQGWSSVGYIASSVPVTRIKQWLALEKSKTGGDACLFSDDFIISYAIALDNSDLFKIANRYVSVDNILPLSYGLAPGALHRESTKVGVNWDVNQMNIFTKERIRSCFEFLLEHAE